MMMRPLAPAFASFRIRSCTFGRSQRGDEQLSVAHLAAVSGEVVEEMDQVGTEVGIGAEQAEVLVETGRVGL